MDSRATKPPRSTAIAGTRGRRRDRHGRGFRYDLIPSHLPGYRSRREAFDDTVLDAVAPVLERFGRRLEHLRVTVEEVPPADPAPWEMQTVPLGRYLGADRRHPPRVVLYRRPIETRCAHRGEVELMVRQVLSEQIGAMLSLPPEDVDPGAWSA